MEALVVLAVPAVVKLVELLNKKDWQSAGKILLAAAVGILAGMLGLQGLDVSAGLAAGLSAAGIVTVAQKAAPKQQQEQNVKVTP